MLLNVDVNLPNVADAEKRAGWAAERAALEKQGVELAAQILNGLPTRIPPGR